MRGVPLLLGLTALATFPALAAPVVLEPQPRENGRLVWHTRHFQIHSEVRIGERDLQRLARVADQTAEVLKEHPLPLYAPPPGRPRIEIFGTTTSYREAGASPDSAGMYLWRRQAVVLNGRHLFVSTPGSGLRPVTQEPLVVHELVHLCMHRVQHRVPMWFAEGVAEYFACAHQGNGRFDIRNLDRAIPSHLRKRHDRGSPQVAMAPVDEIVPLSNEEWGKRIRMRPIEEVYRPYATSLLLCHYYIHGGKERNDELRAMLSAPRGEHARPDPDAAATEAALVRYWKPKGLDPLFIRE